MISFYDGITESRNIALPISPLTQQEFDNFIQTHPPMTTCLKTTISVEFYFCVWVHVTFCMVSNYGVLEAGSDWIAAIPC